MNFEPLLLSTVEKDFIQSSFGRGLRVDGRGVLDFRPISLEFYDNGNCEIKLGKTRVGCVVTAAMVNPFEDKAGDGFYSFEVILSPMASASFPRDGWTEDSVEMSRVVERGLRQSGALDPESLCVVSGVKVWSVSCVITVLDDCGNLIDACSLAAIASLLHFRLPSYYVEKESGEILLHEESDQCPTPLTIHHIPVSVTFGLLSALSNTKIHQKIELENDNLDDDDRVLSTGNDVVILDPVDKEEEVLEGTLSLTVNSHKELCAIQKAGGCPIDENTLNFCLSIAMAKSKELTDYVMGCVDESLKQKEYKQKKSIISYLEA